MEKGFENHNISLVPSFWADTDPTANSYLKQDSHEIWRKAGVLGYPSHGLRASSGAGGQSRWGTGGHYCLFIIQVPVQNASILGKAAEIQMAPAFWKFSTENGQSESGHIKRQ